MKVDEDILRKILQEAITDINKKKTKIEKVKEFMYSMYNITSGESAFILNGKTPLDLIQKDMLFKITNVLYEVNKRIDSTFDYNKLDINTYFTEEEKTIYSQKINRNKKDKDSIIKAGNWMQVQEDQYVIKIYPNELIDDYIGLDKFNYNPETQRYLTKLKDKNGDEIEVITFDGDACEAIYDDMSNGLYISNTLALNVNPDFSAPPRIFNGNLIIPNDSEIDCIDGYHRLRAAINTKIRHPEWNQPLVFFLFVCDVEKACRYILEEDFKIHLSEEQVQKTDDANAVNFIVKKLNEDINFILRGTIEGKKYKTVSKVIEKLFSPKRLYTPEDRQNAVQLSNFIKENINLYIENDNLYGMEVTKEIWFIYLCVLKHCIDKKLSFELIIKEINIEKLSKEMNFTKTPSERHYNIIKEALQYV